MLLPTLLFLSFACAFYVPSFLTCSWRGARETDGPLQGPKAWGNPGRVVGLLCPKSQDFPQLHVGKQDHQSAFNGKTLEWIIMLTGEEELFCIRGGKDSIKMFCRWVLLKELLLLASPATASMWMMRAPVGKFSPRLQQHTDKYSEKRNCLQWETSSAAKYPSL